MTMETLIVHAETPEKSEALKAVLKVLNISYEQEEDTTEYLLSTQANREALRESLSQIKEGKTLSITLDDIWK
jgi:hypothetical protein